MRHVENPILLLSVFDVAKPRSHNEMMHRTMSGSQPSITGYGRAGPFIVFIFTQFMAYWCQQYKNKPPESQLWIHVERLCSSAKIFRKDSHRG